MVIKENQEYLEKKRIEILEAIKPICESFEIKDYDYLVNHEKGIERLVINGTQIGCRFNSLSAVIDELIGYIFVQRWTRNRSLGAFQKQTLNVIRRYWI